MRDRGKAISIPSGFVEGRDVLLGGMVLPIAESNWVSPQEANSISTGNSPGAVVSVVTIGTVNPAVSKVCTANPMLFRAVGSA